MEVHEFRPATTAGLTSAIPTSPFRAPVAGAAGSTTAVPRLVARNIEIFSCPACGGDMQTARAGLQCLACERDFGCDGVIPLLFWPNEWDSSQRDVTDTVKQFYEENPFPNYDDTDSRRSFAEKAERSVFARLLNEQIPRRARVLVAGGGTGQLENFLGMSGKRTVFGADLCLNSLRLASGFQQRAQIANTCSLQMNLFRPAFKPASFDFVICSGVLHHTSDPFGGFRSLANLVKPGGYVLIGLYNRIGRLTTDARRFVFSVTRDRFTALDAHLRDTGYNAARQRAWFMDQYKHPHESKHTIGEVQGWFDQTGFKFMNAIPKATAFDAFAADEELFGSHARGSKLDHALVQLNMLLHGGRDGALFLMIGRKVAAQG